MELIKLYPIAQTIPNAKGVWHHSKKLPPVEVSRAELPHPERGNIWLSRVDNSIEGAIGVRCYIFKNALYVLVRAP